jgi:hypothetical protein
MLVSEKWQKWQPSTLHGNSNADVIASASCSGLKGRPRQSVTSTWHRSTLRLWSRNWISGRTHPDGGCLSDRDHSLVLT